jgi:hypothetical protein
MPLVVATLSESKSPAKQKGYPRDDQSIRMRRSSTIAGGVILRGGALDRLPEAECTIADGQVWCDLEATPLDVDEELAPALRALHSRMHGDRAKRGPEGAPDLLDAVRLALTA